MSNRTRKPEIEKRYLVRDFALERLPDYVQLLLIHQQYLISSDSRATERVRSSIIWGEERIAYTHTIKIPIRPIVRDEDEGEIDRKEYIRLLERADPSRRPIRKIRHVFPWEVQKFEFDLFTNPSGLMLLEIELTHENVPVIMPPFLVGKVTDVSYDGRYSSSQIALHGIPKV